MQFLQFAGTLKTRKAVQNCKLLLKSNTFSFLRPRPIKSSLPVVNKTPVSTQSIFRRDCGILQQDNCAPRGVRWWTARPRICLHRRQQRSKEQYHLGKGLMQAVAFVSPWVLVFFKPFIRKNTLPHFQQHCSLPALAGVKQVVPFSSPLSRDS